MNTELASQCIRSGILEGNGRLAKWTGGEWVCERGNVEQVLVYAVADRFHEDMGGWLVWPETEAEGDFKWIGTNYREYVYDCLPESVFGGIRYDLGLLRLPKTISGLIEIKRYWTPSHLEEKGDLTKLARTLFYLGKKPQGVQTGAKDGVFLESVFFAAFVWHVPNKNDRLEIQYQKIDTEVCSWWKGATTGGHHPIQERFKTVYGVCPKLEIKTHPPKSGTGSKRECEAGAVCVCLSLDDNP